MNRWVDLKEAFWRIADSEPGERARALQELASADPDLHRTLEQLLAADARDELLLPLFESPSHAHEPPSRIGSYDILGVIGTGGMGEVYRAHDSRLHRQVAIKLLPRTLTRDQERLHRFEREARTLALLNHPHIAQVYGLEESAGTLALVMELVEGPTLQQFMSSQSDKRIGLTRVLTIAGQIADGLDAAHEKGIVHSDLKPGNIALTPSGDVKILDFGIARNMAEAALADPGPTPVLAGTPAYMSPEQARGVPVDKRTDIWAFGCVLYELLADRRVVVALTATDGPGAVSPPDITALPADTPTSVRSLIRHCLEPDPRRRLRDIADARLTIDDILNQPAENRGSANVDRDTGALKRRRVLIGVAAALAAAAVAGLGAWYVTSRAIVESPVISFVVLPPGMNRSREAVAASADSWFAISPDGRYVVVVAAEQNARERLWVRELAHTDFRPLPETEGASYPFWHPDSQQIAFLADDRLKKIAVSGGTPVTLAEGGYRSGTWGRDDVILIAPDNLSPLHRITPDGESTAITTIDSAGGEVQHAYPALLPDGRHFLYVSNGGKAGALANRGVYLGSLDSKEPPRLVLPGATRAQYASGHILFLRNGQLMAQPFDSQRLKLTGTATALVEQVKASTTGATGVTGTFSASNTGVLMYDPAYGTRSQPIWFDHSGNPLSRIGPVANHTDLTLSPDGTRLALATVDPTSMTDLWIYETNGSGRRVTFDRTDEFAPAWSPDGSRILYSVQSKEGVDLFIKDPSATSPAMPLQVDSRNFGRFALDWSRDFFLYVGGGRVMGQSDLWIAPVANPTKARALIDSAAVETHGHVSPRGGWFVFASSESGGRMEVYVDRFPALGDRRPVSTNGGAWPRWSRDGTAIYFVSDNQLMAAAIRATPAGLDIAPPQRLFAIRPRPQARLDAYAYDVSPDGRFVVNTVIEETESTSITLSQQWTAALAD